MKRYCVSVCARARSRTHIHVYAHFLPSNCLETCTPCCLLLHVTASRAHKLWEITLSLPPLMLCRSTKLRTNNVVNLCGFWRCKFRCPCMYSNYSIRLSDSAFLFPAHPSIQLILHLASKWSSKKGKYTYFCIYFCENVCEHLIVCTCAQVWMWTWAGTRVEVWGLSIIWVLWIILDYQAWRQGLLRAEPSYSSQSDF